MAVESGAGGSDRALRGEMAARVAAYDWSRTPLGPRESWSPSLKLIVATILASQFPMAVRWGPDFVLIYNDGYLPMLGDKHPRALGIPFREAWPELQEQFAPLHQRDAGGRARRVLRRGSARCASRATAASRRMRSSR